MYNGVKAMIESDKSMRPNPKAKSQTFIEKVVDVAEKSAAKIETNLSEKKSEAKIAASSSALSIKKSVAQIEGDAVLAVKKSEAKLEATPVLAE